MKQYTDDNEFAILILHHRETLSDEEVSEWLDDPAHVELLGKMACLRMEAGNINLGDGEQFRKRLHRQLYIRRRIRYAVSVAALILLAIGIWSLWKSTHAPEPPHMAQLEHIAPGSKKAQLILDDGKIIPLQPQTQKIIELNSGTVQNDSLEGLKYAFDKTAAAATAGIYHTLSIPVGGFYTLELSDGTKVWLNAASELKYPVQFSGQKREVYLEGEGYFQVSTDTARQFIVHLKNASVAVLGTKFNVNAYTDEQHIYTTLAEGSVAFYSELRHRQIILKPGMQSVMDVQTGVTSVEEVDPSVYSAWIDGRFVFPAMNLETIMRQLQRWYDLEVFYQNPEAKNYEFRGAVSRDMDIRSVLDIIEETTDLKFDINNKTIVVRKIK